MPALNLSDDEAALLMELIGKSSISSDGSICKQNSSIPLSMSVDDLFLKQREAAELDNIILNTYFEDEDEEARLRSQYAQSNDNICGLDHGFIPTSVSHHHKSLKKTRLLTDAKDCRNENDNECDLFCDSLINQLSKPTINAAAKRKRVEKNNVEKQPKNAKQIATAKRKRINGQFMRCKIKWIPACASQSTYDLS